MVKRINILVLALLLCLSLTICITRGVQGRGNLKRGEYTAPPISKSPRLRQTSPDIESQGNINRPQFNHRPGRAIFSLLNGKRYFEEGVLLNNQKDYSGAAEKFKEALLSLEKSDHIQAIALTHLNLAVCLQILQERKESLQHFKTALDISTNNGFYKYEAKALQGSGLILNSMDQKEEAVICLDKALNIHRTTADIQAEAVDWLIKGIIESPRNPDRARSYFECALRISEDIGDIRLERKTYAYLDDLRERLHHKKQTRAGGIFPL